MSQAPGDDDASSFGSGRGGGDLDGADDGAAARKAEWLAEQRAMHSQSRRERKRVTIEAAVADSSRAPVKLPNDAEEPPQTTSMAPLPPQGEEQEEAAKAAWLAEQRAMHTRARRERRRSSAIAAKLDATRAPLEEMAAPDNTALAFARASATPSAPFHKEEAKEEEDAEEEVEEEEADVAAEQPPASSGVHDSTAGANALRTSVATEAPPTGTAVNAAAVDAAAEGRA